MSVAQRFIAFLETGDAKDVFAENVFVDSTLPRWRLQWNSARRAEHAREVRLLRP